MNTIHQLIKTLKTTFYYMVGISETYKSATEEYPDHVSARMAGDLPPRYRGFLYNDTAVCSGCKFCVDTCPVDCIDVETEPGPELGTNWVSVFDIDHAKCIFCGLCVEVCPTKSLRHTREYEGSAFHLTDLVKSFGKGWATQEMKQTWAQKQVEKDSKVKERSDSEKSPVGAELKRRTQKDSDRG